MFSKNVNTTNRKEMISFLSKHFRYYTMNAWNGMLSYANNVKLHHLPIPYELKSKAYAFLEAQCEQYMFAVDDLISDFTADTGYSAGFNGRSGGYIVLYDTTRDTDNHVRTLMRGIDDFEDFNDWPNDMLAERVKLVSRFDKLCDDIFDTFMYYVEHATIKYVDVIHTEKVCVAEIADD